MLTGMTETSPLGFCHEFKAKHLWAYPDEEKLAGSSSLKVVHHLVLDFQELPMKKMGPMKSAVMVEPTGNLQIKGHWIIEKLLC